MKIVVSGGTGFIGGALVSALLSRNHSAIVLTRASEKSSSSPLLQYATWDSETQGDWARSFDGADAVINLAGRSLAGGRWTAKEKSQILASRIRSTGALVEAMRNAKPRPRTLINASAVGFYGALAEEEATEEHSIGSGFLSEVCGRWEEKALEAENFGTRVVLTRFGLVMEKDGGVLEKLLLPFRFFLGAVPGTGKQWVSWVHRDDVVGAILFALGNDAISGPINVTSPHPARMGELCRTLAQVSRRPCWASIPPPLIRLALGEMGSVLLDGQKVAPKKLLEMGYQFKYSQLHQALESILMR